MVKLLTLGVSRRCAIGRGGEVEHDSHSLLLIAQALLTLPQLELVIEVIVVWRRAQGSSIERHGVGAGDEQCTSRVRCGTRYSTVLVRDSFIAARNSRILAGPRTCIVLGEPPVIVLFSSSTRSI